MNKTGGVIGIIAGVFAVIAALVTLLFGGLASAFHADKANTVVGLGWGGVLFSFLVIVFGALAFSKPKLAGWGLIISSILGAILGGTLVAVFMILSLVGGILSLLGSKKAPENVYVGAGVQGIPSHEPVTTSASILGTTTSSTAPKKRVWPWVVVSLIVMSLFFIVVGKNAKTGTPVQDLAAPASSAVDEKKIVDDLVLAEDSKIQSKTITDWADLSGDPMATYAKLTGTNTMTSIQKQNQQDALQKNLANAKGKIVIWDLIVNDVSINGASYLMKTKCAANEGRVDAAGLIQKMQPAVDATLIARNAEDKKAIEGLRSCGVVKVKGKISDYDKDGKIYLNPAVVVEADTYAAVGVRGYKDAETVEVVTKSEPGVVASSAPTPAAPAESESIIATPIASKEPVANTSVPDVAQVNAAEVTLSELDAELNGFYKTLMMKLDKDKQAELRRGELAWIRAKDKECRTDSACLKRYTSARVQELKKLDSQIQ